jgi:hypothetical protein
VRDQQDAFLTIKYIALISFDWFAISIGLELTLPPTVKEVVTQMAMTSIPDIPDIQYDLVRESLGNYIIIIIIIIIILGAIPAYCQS